ncbi:MAG: Holliday junction resolvase RuvX [Candidatus Eremiobacterota bacterium]
MRLMGIDYGRRRVGVALSDPSGRIASPHSTLDGRRLGTLLEEIAGLVRAHEVAELVVGLPVNMDGSLGPQARDAERFAGILRDRLGLPVELQDERLTTAQAGSALRQGGGDPRAVDRVAASLILQAFLDRRRRPHPAGEGQGS